MRALPVVALAVAIVLWLPAAGTGVGAASAADGPSACVGTVEETPEEETVVSIQGVHDVGDRQVKRPALLVSFAPNGSLRWTRNASANDRWWAYDVDRLSNGDLLFATTEPGISVVGAYDPGTDEYAWTERFDGAPDSASNPLVTDAHGAELLGDGELVVADKGEGHERVLVYDREAGEVAWEWRFEDHPEAFPESGGGPESDWTHLNDVDAVNVSESDRVDAEGQWFMLSVRNFDQVAFVDRATGEVELTLGEDDDYETLYRQHNPTHMWGPDGEHTVLVADSRNDRVVEYAYDHDAETWDRVWSVAGFDEPRDAFRLPDGNTLVVDRMGHRTVEVTPQGEIVWEVYTPYQPYDVTRGDGGSEGPTMREHGVEGRFEATGSAAFTDEEIADCAAEMYDFAPSRVDVVAGDVTGERVNDGDGTDFPLVPVAAGAALSTLLVGGLGVFLYRRR